MTLLKSLSNETLWSRTQDLVKKERETTLEVLHHLREIESRRLHLDRGFSSMHDYATRHLGYSGAAAHRRIESMRLLRDLPEMENKVESGELALSTVAMVQGFFKNERKQERAYSLDEKRELLIQVAGKPTREVERVLVARAPESVPFKKESQRVITPELTEIKFLADTELLELLEQVKDLSGGQNAYPDLIGLLKNLARFYLSKKQQSKEVRSVPAPENENSRTPSAAQKRALRARTQDQCEYVDPKSGQRCQCSRNLEVDHVRPYAFGGDTTLNNLQLLCAAHHRRKTERDHNSCNSLDPPTFLIDT